MKLPDELFQLRSLTMLDLSGNYLESLPKQIGQLEALIDVSYTHLDVYKRQVFDSIEDPTWDDGKTDVPLIQPAGRSLPLKKIRTPNEKLI